MRNRKAMTFGVTVVAVMLALASVAFACTTFKGRFDVTAGGGTSQAWGNKDFGMRHCTGANAPVSAAQVPEGGGTITVNVVPTGTSSTNCPSSQVADSSNGTIGVLARHYNIYYVNQQGFVDNSGVWKWEVDCMADAGSIQLSANDGKPNEIWIKNGRSTTGGSSAAAGPRNYAVPSGIPNTTDRAGVCISDTGQGQGNQTPIRIVAL